MNFPACTWVWTCSHLLPSTSLGIWQVMVISKTTSLACFNQPCKAAHKEQKGISLIHLWHRIGDHKETIAEGAALDRGRMLCCFCESKIQRWPSTMMVQGDNHVRKFLQLKYQPVKECKCRKKNKQTKNQQWFIYGWKW